MFDWQYFDDKGEDMGKSPEFASQEEAEQWCGTEWEALAQKGIADMSLRNLDDMSEVYKMGLGTAE